jgi:hypothetical protein
MKEWAIILWFCFIQFDVLRNMTIIHVFYRVPDYDKTLWFRLWSGLLICTVVNYRYGFSTVHFLQTGIMMLTIYPFAFDTLLNLFRAKKFLHMGVASLPEKIFKGQALKYFIVKVWLFLAGLCVLYYQELLNTIPI